MARTRRIRSVTCVELLIEFHTRLQRKPRFTLAQATAALVDVLAFLEIVRISDTLKLVAADPDDDKVIECACVAGATHIITGDRRHLLPLGQHRTTRIVSPTDFLKQFAAG